MHFQEKKALKNVCNEFNKPMERCLFCNEMKSKNQTFLQDLLEEDPLCAKCRNLLKPFRKTIDIEGLKVYGLYQYNEAFAKMIVQYKDCFDEALQDIFVYPYRYQLKLKYHHCIFLPAPSSNEKLEERGFHHVEKMVSSLNIPVENCFVKTLNFKQASLNKKEREEVKKYIELKALPSRKNKLVLVDDVLTTGGTMLAMLKQLNQKGFDATGFVMAIHPLLIKDTKRQFSTVKKHILIAK